MLVVYVLCQWRFDDLAPWGAYAVARGPRPAAPLDAALRMLVEGPTAAERANGLVAPFHDDERESLRSVAIDGTTAHVDFTSAFGDHGQGSHASFAFLTALDATVFQFETIDAVRYTLDGDACEFWTHFHDLICQEIVERPEAGRP